MAKGTRDVSLVIRAKNEASRALDTINESLKQLRNAQGDAQNSAKGTGSALSDLGKELARLRQQMSNVGSESLAKNLTDAAAAVGRLDAALALSTQKQAALRAELQKSATTTGNLARRSQQLTDRLNHQKNVTQQAQGQLSSINATLGQAQRTISTATAETQKFTDRLTRQENALDKTRAKYRDLSQQILATDTPSKTLLASFAKIESRLDKQTAALQKTRSGYAALQQAISKARSELPQLTAAQQQAKAAFDQAALAQEKTSRALANVSRAQQDVANKARQLQKAVDSGSASVAKQASELQKARDELARLQAAASSANAALAQVGSTVRQRLLTSLRDGQKDIAKFRSEWQAAQAAIAKGVRAGGSTSNPSAEMQQLLQTARAQKQAFEQTRNAVAQYRAAIRAAGTDVDKLAAAERAYSAATARVAAALKEATAAARQNASANRDNAASARASASAMDDMRNRGRAAMSWAQRLRGELVALALAYTGLYGAINQLSGVTGAFMELEAATTRMNVAFGGNEAISAREMRWVREEADRLGIQFGILASEYSKFAVAARGTSLEGAETRRIFESVAVAARVNKLSIDQVRGTFLALTQMLSKGAVSMQELRQQLGDRLYGAFNMAADAMGYTTEEFNKLVATGGVASEPFLIKFATELEKVYGEHLPAALDTFTTELGRFQNEVFKTRLNTAQAGFIDGLREALASLTAFLRSNEGAQFFQNLGSAAGSLVKVLAEIPKYYREILMVLSALIGVRVVSWLGGLRMAFVAAVAAARPLPATLGATGAAGSAAAGGLAAARAASIAAMSPMARFQRSMRRLNILLSTSRGRALALRSSLMGLRGALAMVGGIPGLIITGVSMALVSWLTGTEDVIEVTNQHEEQMSRLIDEYSRVKEAAGDWAKTVSEGLAGVTLDMARKNFRDQLAKWESDVEAAFTATGGRIQAENVTISGRLRNSRDPAVARLEELSQKIKEGTITAREYQAALNDMLKDERTTARMRTMIEDASKLTQELVDQENRLLEAATAVDELGGSYDELPPQLRDAVKSFEELAEASGLIQETEPADPLEALNREMEKLRGEIPSLADEIDLLADLASIDEILKTGEAIVGVEQVGDALEKFRALARQAKEEVQEAFDEDRFSDARDALVNPGGSSADIAADLIRKREAFRGTPYWDVNAYRTGFGSDTTTDEDGTVRAVTEATRTTVMDANRDLERRIAEFQSTIINQIGEERWASFNAQQQAVLTSNAYNYGSLTNGGAGSADDLLNAVREGSTQGIVEALRGQASHNGGVNKERREEEAYLFGQAETANQEANLQLLEDSLKAQEKLVEEQNEYKAALADTITQRFEDTALVAGLTREMAVARALEEERANAAEVGLTLTQAQEQAISNSAALTWDLAAADRDSSASKRQLEQIAQRINTLLEFRKELMEQIVALEAADNTEGLAAVQEQVAAVDLAIETAEEQHARYQASIKETSAGLKGMGKEMEETAKKAIATSETIGQSFGEHLNRGLSGFLDKVRETGDVFGAARASFLEFAADFTLNLAKMIAQQALLNLLTMAFGGAGTFMGGVIQGVGGGAMAGGFGSGGSQPMAGGYGSGATRTVSSGGGGGIALVGPSAAEPSKVPQQNPFENIRKYHSGGIAGLAPDEVSATLKRGEEVLTEDDPRHRNNRGAGGGSEKGISVVLLQDERDVAAAMASSAGDDVIFQYLKRNKKTVRSLIG